MMNSGPVAGAMKSSTGEPLPCPLCGQSLVVVIPIAVSPRWLRVGFRVAEWGFRLLPFMLGYALSEIKRHLTINGG